jgi:hypothetical protein
MSCGGHRTLAAHHSGEAARRAWHLAQAATGPDEDVAALLQSVAHVNLWRGDSVGAIGELLRAAELSPAGAGRARRLAEAAYLGETVTGYMRDVGPLLDGARHADPEHAGGLAGAGQPHLLAAGPFRGGQPADIGVPHGSGIARCAGRHQSHSPQLKIF